MELYTSPLSAYLKAWSNFVLDGGAVEAKDELPAGGGLLQLLGGVLLDNPNLIMDTN